MGGTVSSEGARDETVITRMRSEIATLRFLQRRTGSYSSRIQRFRQRISIMESVEGMRMTYFLALNKIKGRMLDHVCQELARIHLELLSHPSNTI